MKRVVSLSILLNAGYLWGQALCGFQTYCIPRGQSALGSWQVYASSLQNTDVQILSGNLSSGRFERWRNYVRLGNFIGPEPTPIIADVDGDGIPNVIAGSDNVYYVFNGVDGSLVWQKVYSSIFELPSTSAVGDVDNDGTLEVVVGVENLGSYTATDSLIVFNGEDGSIQWSVSLGNGSRTSGIKLADVNDDGQVEILYYYASTVYCRRGSDGTLLWSRGAGNNMSPDGALAIGDLNGDDTLDVVGVTWDYGMYSGFFVFALNGADGSPLWTFPTNEGGAPSPVLRDVDNEGRLEVIAFGLDPSYNTAIYAINGEDGSLLWSDTFPNEPRLTPAVADIDGDGVVEVIIATSIYTDELRVYDGRNGNIKWVATSGGSYEPGTIVVADIDPSPGMEIIVPDYYARKFNVFSSSGTLLWSYTVGGYALNTVVGDVDGDGCSEVLMLSSDNTLIALDATVNNGGCHIVGTGDNELGKSEVEGDKHNSQTSVYTVDGRYVGEGLPKRKGVFFVKEGDRVRKVVVR